MKKIKEKILSILGENNKTIKLYKITLSLIVLASILLAFFKTDTDIINKTFVALFLLGIYSFSIETYQLISKKKIPLYMLSILLSMLSTSIIFKTKIHPKIHMIILGSYLIIFLIGIFKIIKEQEDISDYFLRFIQSNIVLGIASTIIQIGILFINIIIIELFPEITDDFYSFFTLEILLIGFLIIPGEIICITNPAKKELVLMKRLTNYILCPIVLVILLIIYCYNIKIIITSEIPSNFLYTIIALTFMCTYPTWLMSNNYQKESKISTLISKYSLYTIIPLIIIQIYSLAIRVYDKGITISRYIGIIIIIFEISCIFLGIIKKQKKLYNIIPITILLIMITAIIPRINAYDISLNNQLKRIKKYYPETTTFASLKKKEKIEVKSSYDYIKEELKGENKIPKYINKKELKKYNQYDEEYKQEEINQKNIIYSNEIEIINVDGYKTIEPYEIWERPEEKTSLEDLLFEEENLNAENIETLKAIIKQIIETNNKNPVNEIKLDDNKAIWINRYNIIYENKSKKIISITIDGYLKQK